MMGWEVVDNALERRWVLKDFSEALGFVSQIALLAEKARHHPEIHWVYNRLTVRLTTHDAGNTITEKDKSLARDIALLSDRLSL
jgi:4a-hydroxytetrahydrobiopterin dehydratase